MSTSEAGQNTAVASNKKKSTVALQELQETIGRISAHQGVLAVMVLNGAGDVVTQTGAQEVLGNPLLLKQMLAIAKSYVQSVPAEAEAAQAQDDDADDLISFLRVRSQHEEVLVAPKNDYVLVVVQDPNQSVL